jgi:hypothetical protein
VLHDVFPLFLKFFYSFSSPVSAALLSAKTKKKITEILITGNEADKKYQ